MKKSLIYYLSQIKEAYPEITDIKKPEFEKFSAEINAQIEAGQPVTAHKQLYGKTYRFLKILAKYYAENGIDYRSFKDNLSALQLMIMEKINNKVDKNEWFVNFTSYVPVISQYVYTNIKQLKKETASNMELNAKLVENLLNNEAMKRVYEKELKNANINELKSLLNEALGTLTTREEYIIREYYEKGRTMEEIGVSCNFTTSNVAQILHKALRKLRHPKRSVKFYDFYNFDND